MMEALCQPVILFLNFSSSLRQMKFSEILWLHKCEVGYSKLFTTLYYEPTIKLFLVYTSSTQVNEMENNSLWLLFTSIP